MKLKRTIILFAILPLLLAVIGIGWLISNKSEELSKQQSANLEQSLIEAKKAELKYYTAFAKNSIASIYHSAGPDNQAAKEQVKAMLRAISYGPDGYFFVYDYAGKNIVHPRQGFRIGKNWIDLKDKEGNLVIKDLIDAAKNGGGYTNYVWEQPSTGKIKKKIGYAVGLDNWGWMLGTGMYIDDVTSQARALETIIAKQTTQTFLFILVITVGALAMVAGTGILLLIQQHNASRTKLKVLNQRIVETQEHERKRVARELHDGISQQLSSTKYVFELAHIQQQNKTSNAKRTIEKGIVSLANAITEVRRISRDLRPGLLDDLGLAPAIKALSKEFGERSGINVKITTVPTKELISDQAKTACFRIAQEALNNISKHANASQVCIDLTTTKKCVTLTVKDNGTGFLRRKKKSCGIGLTNMRERVTHHGGEFKIMSDEYGTTLIAKFPTLASSEISDSLQSAAE